jgi:hypothetical protein
VSPLSSILIASELGLARAYALEPDVAKSRAAYDALFAQWKNADQDLPTYKQARTEYAKLQSSTDAIRRYLSLPGVAGFGFRLDDTSAFSKARP